MTEGKFVPEHLDFTPEELSALTRQKPTQSRLSEPQEVEYALWRWRRLVTDLTSTGCRWSDAEYENELFARTALERYKAVSPSLSSKLEAILMPLDEQFIESTRPVTTALGGDYERGQVVPDDQVYWWYFRYPRRHRRELSPDERDWWIEFADEE